MNQPISISVTDSSGNISYCNFNLSVFCDIEISIPEFISPNDDGKNDIFVITNIEKFPNNNLKIFNRWGSLVYELSGYNNQWNGESNTKNLLGSGETLPSGVYFYILELNNDNISNPNFNGFIQLSK